MRAVLFLQGSLGGLNSRDGRPLFMEQAAGRPLLGLLLEEAAASGCFDRTVFVTSAETADDPVVEYLENAWPAVETVRLGADSPFAFDPASRRSELLHSMDYATVLSVEGIKAIVPAHMQDPSQTVFVLDVNDAPLCSRRYFEKALPLARESGFFASIGSGSTTLCGFQWRAFEQMSAHQRSLRVAEAAAARDRAERAIAEARREAYLADDAQIAAVQAWKAARAKRYGPFRGGFLPHTLRDWVGRHADGAARVRFREETEGESVSITTRSALETAQTAYELPAAEERVPEGEGVRRFYPQFPSYLEVELTSRCNLACRFCPQTRLSRPKGDLGLDELEALLGRVGDFVFLLNFSGFGEPTLHPGLFDAVRLAKSKGIPRVEIETNGTRLDEAFLDELFESGLDVLTVNLDALDEADGAPCGSVHELARRFIERRGEAARPFLVLQRVNAAMAGQDGKVQRDFTLWHDAADAVMIRPFNTYRGTLPDKRVIDFAPLERTVCRKLLASGLVLSSGRAVMCEQCFDGQHPSDDGSEILDESGGNPYLEKLRLDQKRGTVGEFCAPCTQWYQQDVAWNVPTAHRLWFERALQEAATEPAEVARP